MNRFNIRQLALLLVLPCFVGCASLKIENMVINQTSSGTQHPVTVAVKTIGGSPNVKWYSATITPEEFQKAVTISLKKSDLFKAIVGQDIADYLVNIDLTYAGSHPGFSMTAWVNVNWILVERKSGQRIWSAEITGEGHAGAGEAFNGEARQYIALERGAQSNINQALNQIRKLRLGHL
jgi:hypothetical protein